MGAGHPLFDDDGQKTDGILYDEYGNEVPAEFVYAYVGGQKLWDEIIEGKAGGDADGDGKLDPWTYIESRDDFLALMEGDTPKRVLGTARTISTLQQMRTRDPGDNNDLTPYEVPFNRDVPTLVEMTRGALNVLDEDPDGFLLMVEGGAVDWASHGNRTGRMIEEMDDFNASVEAVISWVDQNDAWDETLVIVTGDHECGYLLGPGSGSPDIFTEVIDNGPGRMPGCQFYSSSHTNSLIPLYAKGRGSELFRGYANGIDPELGMYIDNTEVAKVIFALYDEVETRR
jgi:alkaline phosphatase